MKKFDVSWKVIVLVLIVLAFLLNGLDMVVHGAETPAKYHTSVANRMYEFQKIEDRELKILKEEEPEIYSGDWFRCYNAKAVDSDRTEYFYRWYDSEYHEVVDSSIILPNELVDTVYQYTLILSTDSIWEQAVERICTQYEL